MCNILNWNYNEIKTNNTKVQELIPKDLIIMFYRILKLHKKKLNLLLFLHNQKRYSSMLQNTTTQHQLVTYMNDYVAYASFKIDNFYKQDIFDYLTILTKNYKNIHNNFCIVCCNPRKFYCSQCKITPYCSKNCQEIDWKYLSHKLLCKEKHILNTFMKSNYELVNEYNKKDKLEDKLEDKQNIKRINLLKKAEKREAKIKDKKSAKKRN